MLPQIDMSSGFDELAMTPWWTLFRIAVENCYQTKWLP